MRGSWGGRGVYRGHRMRRSAVLFAVGLALAGCKAAERERPPRADREGGVGTASRTKPTPKGWLDGPTPNLGEVDTPPADSWTDPRDRGFDVDREVRGLLAGFVEDPDGRKLRDVFIQVEPADPTAGGGGAPVGVQTDRHGYFLIKGLKPKQAYVLTAQTTHDGQTLGGRAYAQTGTERSQFVRISLIDGLGFPGAGRGSPDRPPASPGNPTPAGTPAPTLADPPNLSVPPPVLPSGSASTLPAPVPHENDRPAPARPDADSDGAFSPVGPRPDTPQSPAPVPAGPGVPPVPPLRKDLVTEGPAGIWRPPAASIPTAPQSSPSTIPASPAPGRSESKSVAPNAEFVLLDTTGYRREFPTGRAGELVLLDFMTTTCVPCKKAIPTLNALHAKYGLLGVEVIGVTCDPIGVNERRLLSAEYKQRAGVNYLLYVEPGEEPGRLMGRFGVTGYPTLVLLDGSGRVRWQGHPKDADELERVIAAELAGAGK